MLQRRIYAEAPASLHEPNSQWDLQSALSRTQAAITLASAPIQCARCGWRLHFLRLIHLSPRGLWTSDSHIWARESESKRYGEGRRAPNLKHRPCSGRQCYAAELAK